MGSWGHGAWKGTGHVVLHAHCPVLQPMTAMHTTPEVSHPRHPGPARADLALLHAQGAWGIHRGMHRGHGGACTGGMGHGACTTGTFTPQSSLYPAFTPPLPPSFAPSNLIRSTLSSTLSSTLAGVPPPCDFPTITSATAGYKRGGCGGNRGGCRGHKGGVQQRTSEVSVGTSNSEGLIRCVECLGTPRAHAGGTGSCWAHAGQPRVVHGLAASPPPASCPLLPAPPPGPVL